MNLETELDVELDPAALELLPAEAGLTGGGETCGPSCVELASRPTCVPGFSEIKC